VTGPALLVTRRYDFPAAHVLRRPDFSDAQNRRTYGKCANPAGHGHDYGVEVTVTGPPDARTGRVVDPDRLDRLFEERVQARLGHRLLNELELFRDRVPTAENVAAVVHELLGPALAETGSARLARVRIVETCNNSFVYGAME
jgi:6-pyruvoyltetrahydropterin/6-carboxytetrahydropterin synthase